ncbi:hypothetical protein EVAR_17170_1 [Eumeta japonica]|uniref:Uncharacterized protein n=1 Tax=Eumeta variegata TaxID=151549 RepID=A0A4C1UAA1_EUMVA|nr:hypothetical protein EVAR_17170_1 [Eumeta japonica]
MSFEAASMQLGSSEISARVANSLRSSASARFRLDADIESHTGVRVRSGGGAASLNTQSESYAIRCVVKYSTAITSRTIPRLVEISAPLLFSAIFDEEDKKDKEEKNEDHDTNAVSSDEDEANKLGYAKDSGSDDV